MKRKTVIALMTALVLAMSLSACGEDDTFPPEDTTVTKKEAPKEEAPESEEETSAEEFEDDTAQKEAEKIQSALGDMPYYGDTANCKMTAEQATAYAQLIADGLAGDFSFRDGYDENNVDILTWSEPFQVFDFDMGEKVEVDRFNIMLGDFAGDGVPYLYLYSTNNRVDNQSYEIYGWADNTVKLVHDTDENKNSWRFPFYLYEDGNNQCEMKIDCVGYYPPAIYYEVDTYVFSKGTIKETNSRVEELKEDGSWYITENGTESVYTQEEYDSLIAARGQKNHTHTLPCTCFYDMTPCTLEKMVTYLNAYASVMSDGQSVPVEIIEVKEAAEPSVNSNLSYSIDGNNIIYNGITYTDLYTNIKTIESESQYDADTLIKLVLQYYPSNETVYTHYYMPVVPDEIEEGVDYNDRSVDELWEESALYIDLRNKYADTAEWELSIYKYGGIDEIYLIGGKSFTLIADIDKSIEVDVSDF